MRIKEQQDRQESTSPSILLPVIAGGFASFVTHNGMQGAGQTVLQRELTRRLLLPIH